MHYISTRGGARPLDFEGVALTGLASDGGLYVPDHWPAIDAKAREGFVAQSYAGVADHILSPFMTGSMDEDSRQTLLKHAYAGFRHPDIAPLKEIGDDLWVLELFHGPTLAFKDFALQFLGRLLDHILARRGMHITIVGATSGDTGSAAIDAFKGSKRVKLFMLHPSGRISDVQRRQMTTVRADNIFNIAIDGTFDDCQALVKALFADAAFREQHRLNAVNSINWARIAAQTVYYFYAASRLGGADKKITFSVPSGNFGNVFAGYAAGRMGLGIEKLIIATNENDILARAFRSGDYSKGTVQQTLSPAMDIQQSSNFERLLFDLLGRDGDAVRQQMIKISNDGGIVLTEPHMARLSATFSAMRVDDGVTLDTIGDVYRQSGYLIDPHTAVGVRAAQSFRRKIEGPVVCLSTAHPAKFPAAVEKATGVHPPLPDDLADLFTRREHFKSLTADLDGLKSYISERAFV